MRLYQPTCVIVLTVRPSFGIAFTADSCRIHGIKRNLLRFFSANNHIQCDSDNRISSDRTSNSTAAIINRSQGPSTALDSIEDTVAMCLSHHRQSSSAIASSLVPMNAHINILQHPKKHRESIGVASNLQQTLKSFARSGVHCRRCWLQKKHCICEACVEIPGDIPRVDKLFLLTHHKEICLAVDTAKLIVSSFPQTVNIVISGIPRAFQPIMGEMLDVISASEASTYQDILEGRGTKCLILFPTKDARTFDDIVGEVWAHVKEMNEIDTISRNTTAAIEHGWNVIVIDGTWSQARKMHAKYLPEKSSGMLYRVQLSNDNVEKLDNLTSSSDEQEERKGLQLRRHPIKWREISTLEATRLLLLDMHPDGEFDTQSQFMSKYQDLSNAAVKRQIGPLRVKDGN